MSFTDDDLKRLKEDDQITSFNPMNEMDQEYSGWFSIETEKIIALLARLEAAERMYLIIKSKMSIPEKQQEHIIEAWCKACGK